MAQSQAASQAPPAARAPATSASGAPSASAGPSAPAELVTRPDPGLARGVWEAPPWAFWTALGVVVVAATLYALSRAGVLRSPRAGAPRGPKT